MTGARLSRRGLVAGAGAVAACAALPRGARAEGVSAEGSRPEGARKAHGLSSFGELKYPADFPHFGYVDPAAPKGGRFSSQITQTLGNQAFDTFDTLNVYVFRGNGAAGMPMTFDSLMVRALDEPDALYGLVARAVEVAEDGRSLRFLLRPQARFNDGSRLTARDVAFSLKILRDKGHPTIAQEILDLEDAVAESDEVVLVRFRPGRGRDLPLVVAQLPIFSEAWWKARDFEASTLEAPLGSGPYRLARMEVGRFVELERVPDYWAAELPVNVGQNNFDTIRYEYFRDRQTAFEAFKGGAFTYRQEFTSHIWANGYDFPAVREGRVRRITLPDSAPAAIQGWWFNTRRPVFRDPRVREAIGLCFDFTWTNRVQMYDAYTRTESFFERSDLKATGKPGPAELALLEALRDRHPDRVPAELFGEPLTPPVSDGSGRDRALLARANALLKEAGCVREGNVLKLPDGTPLAFEFLDNDPIWEQRTQPFIRNLGLLGIQARQRIVDPSQYQLRTRDFDFDIVIRNASQGATPGPSLRTAYGSAEAAIPGSNNLAGIADPVVDALVDRAVTAASRSELEAACRTLDRVLRAGRYWIPMWYAPNHRLAVWDVYGHPETPPTYGLGAPDLWWHDAAKARKIGPE